MVLLFSPDDNEARMKEEAAGDDDDDDDDDGDDSQDGDDDDDKGTITEFRFVPSDKAACKSEQRAASRPGGCSGTVGHSAISWPESQSLSSVQVCSVSFTGHQDQSQF